MSKSPSIKVFILFLIVSISMHAQLNFHKIEISSSHLCFQCENESNSVFNTSNQQTFLANRFKQKSFDASRFNSLKNGYSFMNQDQVIPPKMNIANGLLRFSLEMIALGAMGKWGYELTDNSSQYLLMLGVPLVAAFSWGTYTVANDPSRGKNGSVLVSGLTRLFIEAAVFGFATWAMHDLNEDAYALAFGSLVIVHYAISFDRVKWLLDQ